MNVSTKIIIRIVFYLLLLLLINCKKNPNIVVSKKAPFKENFALKDSAIQPEVINYHTDTAYQYENRTGTSGQYKYNYDVLGFDSKGNAVIGNISIKGKEGIGYLFDANQNKIKVIVEWTGYGTLKAMDSHNNQYELEVE